MTGVRQFIEDDVLSRALDLFWVKGYVNTSMQDLAEATGVQRGSLYNAYGGKEALFLKVFEVYRKTYVGKMRQALDKPRLRDALRSFFTYLIASMRTGEPARSCLSTKTALGNETLEKPLQAALQQLLDEIEAVLVERMSREGEPDRLRLPAKQAARLGVTLTRGLVVLERIYSDEKRSRAAADDFVNLLLAGPDEPPPARRAPSRRAARPTPPAGSRRPG